MAVFTAPASDHIAGSFAGNEPQPLPSLKRWDGTHGMYQDWDHLGKDPELWFGDGDCLIHLHDRGLSTNSPSFKVSLSALVDSGCHPLIDRFMPSQLSGIEMKTRDGTPRRGSHGNGMINLYIPSPSLADDLQAFRYHVATRNLFAWVFKRPLVGEHLGAAIVGLLNSMHEFRSGTENNVADLMEYLSRRKYLNLSDQPNHSLAILHLAETFEMSDLYKQAFGHCVGMSGRLYLSTDYDIISFKSRELIREARATLNEKLETATNLLKNFLDDELSESHLGLPSGSRAHLEQFRAFLLSFYAGKLGYYPPRSYDAKLCRRMGRDIQALYDLLVDDGYDHSEAMPSVAAGGICTLQLTQTFDSRNGFQPLPHPLPRLPHISSGRSTRRMSWVPILGSNSPGQRLRAHDALIAASNCKEDILRNDLVKAYRRFEQDYVTAPTKFDRREKVSLADARKVRWIMVYAVHQVLRSINCRASETHGDDFASYHMAMPSDRIPPWHGDQDIGGLVRSQTDMAIAGNAPFFSWGHQEYELPAGAIELKPDIDYFALTHRDEDIVVPRFRRASMSNVKEKTASVLGRSSSVSRALNRSSTIRRSIQRLRPSTAAASQPMAPTALKSAHHEIMVHGYGDGTNSVELENCEPEHDEQAQAQCISMASRSGSTASQANSSVSSAPDSTSGSAETAASSVQAPSPTWPSQELPLDKEPRPRRWSRPTEIFQSATGSGIMSLSTSGATQHRRLMSTVLETSGHSRHTSTKSIEEDPMESTSVSAPVSPATPGFLRRHSIIIPDLTRKSTISRNRTTPLHIYHPDNGEDDAWALRRDSNEDWAAMVAFMDATDAQSETNGADAMPAWEQYADLGGLTEMK